MNDIKTHLMIDIETMGTGADAAIASIGIVPFADKVFLDEGIIVNVDLSSNLGFGRGLDPRTVVWWLNQEKKAQESLFTPEPITLYLALIKTTEYIKKWLGKKKGIWANGATFDLLIMRNAYKTVLNEVPWDYRQECCIRSLRKISSTIGLNFSDYKQGTLHNSLDDAIGQAQFVVDFIEKVKASG